MIPIYEINTDYPLIIKNLKAGSDYKIQYFCESQVLTKSEINSFEFSTLDNGG